MSTEHILTPFLNRDGGAFDPAGWFQLVPKGTFKIQRKEAGKVVLYEQVVDDESVKRMAEAFANRLASNPGYKLLIDFEHFSHDTEKSSSAAAWVNKVEARADGLWAQAEWSDEGETAIKNRRYRYLSPVWLPSQVERLGPQRVRPIAVNDAGLTNKPNLGAALQPFWNREDSLSGQPAQENQNQHIAMKEQLIALFGLAATASEADILAKAAAFKNRAVEADALQGKFDTLTTEHAAFKNRHTALLSVSVDRTLEEFKGVITEESKDAWKNRLTEDFAGTTALLKGIKAPAAGGDTKKPVHQPGKGAANAAKKTDGEEEGSAFLNRVKELRAADSKLTEGDAMYQAAQANPDLYEEYRTSLAPAGE